MLNKKTRKNAGITLIALVITIVVLLILAGVSIATLTGDNGILTQATKAKEQTQKASIEEQRKLAQIEATMNSENTQYKGVTIPAGFAPTRIEGEDTLENGLVITDSKGNEFVWIPCTIDGANDTLKYQRTRFGVEEVDNGTEAFKDELTLLNNDVTYSTTDTNNGINAEISKEIVAQIQAEKKSISTYGGYYIGRYETGVLNNTAVIQQNQTPYAEIKWSTAYSLAKGIDTGNRATSYLCSSYAWDTAINFIQNNTTFTNYATARTVAMNENWFDMEVKDASGNTIKPAGITQRLETGRTTAKANIYDMGGNVAEFTTELMPGTSETVVFRGGNYYSYNHTPAGSRWDNIAGSSNAVLRFPSHFILKVALSTEKIFDKGWNNNLFRIIL